MRRWCCGSRSLCIKPLQLRFEISVHVRQSTDHVCGLWGITWRQSHQFWTLLCQHDCCWWQAGWRQQLANLRCTTCYQFIWPRLWALMKLSVLYWSLGRPSLTGIVCQTFLGMVLTLHINGLLEMHSDWWMRSAAVSVIIPSHHIEVCQTQICNLQNYDCNQSADKTYYLSCSYPLDTRPGSVLHGYWKIHEVFHKSDLWFSAAWPQASDGLDPQSIRSAHFEKMNWYNVQYTCDTCNDNMCACFVVQLWTTFALSVCCITFEK